MSFPRRSFLELSATTLWAVPALLSRPGVARAQAQNPAPDEALAVSPTYPAHDQDMARDMVGAAHGNVARVRELLAVSGSMAKASWDWGFGDWETAIGAASHVGNPEIVGLLVEHGAHPDHFTMAMMGELDAMRSVVVATPGIQRIRGPHGLTLLHHARQGGEKAAGVVAYLEALGDADQGYVNEPLPKGGAELFVGVYAFGPGPGDRFDVGTNKSGALGIKRLPSGSFRNLFHQGGNSFHPPGNQVVRITFEVTTGPAEQVSIVEGARTITARRVQA